MILAIDIGNSNIVMGGVEDGKILFTERLSTMRMVTDIEYAVLIKASLEMYDISPKKVEGAVLSSVVPNITAIFERAVEKLCGVKTLVVGQGIRTDLNIKIDNPAQLGNDLIVDAVAGIENYPVPQIIIDMGTATTFSVIDREKNYIGAIITTGMATSCEALVSRTSQLPRFSFEKPKKVIGTNTIDSLKSGSLYGNASMIDGIIERSEEELGEKCTVIATGGLAKLVVPFCKKKIILDDELLLKGLVSIYNKNK